MLWEKNHRAFELVGSATGRVVDSSGHVWKGLDGFEGGLIQNTGLVIVGDEDSRRDNTNEGVEIEGSSPVKEIEVHRRVGVAADSGTTNGYTGGGEELERGLLRVIATNFTADDHDGSVGHDHG